MTNTIIYTNELFDDELQRLGPTLTTSKKILAFLQYMILAPRGKEPNKTFFIKLFNNDAEFYKPAWEILKKLEDITGLFYIDAEEYVTPKLGGKYNCRAIKWKQTLKADRKKIMMNKEIHLDTKDLKWYKKLFNTTIQKAYERVAETFNRIKEKAGEYVSFYKAIHTTCTLTITEIFNIIKESLNLGGVAKPCEPVVVAVSNPVPQRPPSFSISPQLQQEMIAELTRGL